MRRRLGVKRASVAHDPCPTKYLVCNGAEGEPGTFKDRFLLYTPTYSPWLNQVELWVSTIEQDVTARGIFTFVTDLRRKLMRYIKHYNKTATHPLGLRGPVAENRVYNSFVRSTSPGEVSAADRRVPRVVSGRTSPQARR